MALALALDDAKTNQIRNESGGRNLTGGSSVTPFFGPVHTRDKPDFPHAHLVQFDPGRISGIHFHVRDQFQVFVGGEGKLGRHALTPYGVHFSRAYTPYGPLVSDAGNGLTCFVLRAHPDPGSQRLPKELGQLKRAPDRQPWQITRPFTFPTLQSGTAAEDILLQAVPDIKDQQGLAAYTLSMKPNAKAEAPDPSHGDGQYLVVVNGSLLHNNKEHQAYALVFVYPQEGPFQIHAGPQGLEALVLNFPQLKRRAVESATPSTIAGFKKWQCALCSFTYDEAQGMPGDGIPAGTRWEDVPDGWNCPDCSANRSDFQMVET